jgi:hypothetical protein
MMHRSKSPSFDNGAEFAYKTHRRIKSEITIPLSSASPPEVLFAFVGFLFAASN